MLFVLLPLVICGHLVLVVGLVLDHVPHHVLVLVAHVPVPHFPLPVQLAHVPLQPLPRRSQHLLLARPHPLWQDVGLLVSTRQLLGD